MDSAASQDPPATLRIAAALFLTNGTLSLVQMAAGFLAQHGTFDLSILSLPIGFSLLRGSAIARICMLILGALVFFGGLYALTLSLTERWFDGLLPEERMLATTTTVLGLSSIGLAWACLIDRNCRDWCRKGPHPTKDRLWAIILIVIVGAFSVLSELRIHAARQLLVRLFPVSTTFRAVEIRDGRPLKTLAIESPVPSLLTSSPKPSQISIIHSAGEDEPSITIKGVQPGPTTLHFTAVGMHPLDYVLSPDTPAEVTLQFKPLASSP